MKITQSKLKQIIKEEIIKEGFLDRFKKEPSIPYEQLMGELEESFREYLKLDALQHQHIPYGSWQRLEGDLLKVVSIGSPPRRVGVLFDFRYGGELTIAGQDESLSLVDISQAVGVRHRIDGLNGLKCWSFHRIVTSIIAQIGLRGMPKGVKDHNGSFWVHYTDQGANNTLQLYKYTKAVMEDMQKANDALSAEIIKLRVLGATRDKDNGPNLEENLGN